MACESIIMGPEAVIGEAGLDEPAEQVTDPTVRSGYREIANRRRTIPAEVALAMLDKNLELIKSKPKSVPSTSWPKISKRSNRSTRSSRKSSQPPRRSRCSSPPAMRGAEGFAKYLAADRAALARALSVPDAELEDDPSLWGNGGRLRWQINGPITPSVVATAMRTIESRSASIRST